MRRTHRYTGVQDNFHLSGYRAIAPSVTRNVTASRHTEVPSAHHRNLPVQKNAHGIEMSTNPDASSKLLITYWGERLSGVQIAMNSMACPVAANSPTVAKNRREIVRAPPQFLRVRCSQRHTKPVKDTASAPPTSTISTRSWIPGSDHILHNLAGNMRVSEPLS